MGVVEVYYATFAARRWLAIRGAVSHRQEGLRKAAQRAVRARRAAGRGRSARSREPTPPSRTPSSGCWSTRGHPGTSTQRGAGSDDPSRTIRPTSGGRPSTTWPPCASVWRPPCPPGSFLPAPWTPYPTLDFAKSGGLVTAIAQDDATGDVLMVAFMNEESFRRTARDGRGPLLEPVTRQGALAQGRVRAATPSSLKSASTIDCDGDVVLLRVEQKRRCRLPHR